MSDHEDYEEEGDDWLYVEEYYDDAAELAEYTCHSPALVPQDDGDYDPYSYFEDIAYLSDSYYDKQAQDPPQAAKRKRNAESSAVNKIHKKSTSKDVKGHRHEPVIWRSSFDTVDTFEDPHTVHGRSYESVTLLKDWKERFQSSKGLMIGKENRVNSDKVSEGSSSPTGERFDLNDIKSVANLIEGESLDKLKAMLVTQGLDPSAVEIVLKDMISGEEPDFASDDEDEEFQDRYCEDGEDLVSVPQDGHVRNNLQMPHRSLKRTFGEHESSDIGSYPESKRVKHRPKQSDSIDEGKKALITPTTSAYEPKRKRESTIDLSKFDDNDTNIKKPRYVGNEQTESDHDHLSRIGEDVNDHSLNALATKSAQSQENISKSNNQFARPIRNLRSRK